MEWPSVLPYQKKNHAMFKLLTDNARLKATKEYSTRRLIVGLGGVFLILLVGVIALFPSYIISNSRLYEATSRLNTFKNTSSTQDAHNLVVWLSEINQKINYLAPVDNEVLPYELFLNVINIKPSGISLKSLTMKKDTKTITIDVTGVAKSRQDLYNFENNLNNSGKFTQIVLPISSFAQDSNIDFEFSFSPN